MVDGLDLAAFHAPYGGSDGRRNQPYDPRMMVKVLVYAYATGTFSSRKIAAKLEEDVAYRERAWKSEAPNGWIKRVLGFRQFSVRGLGAARGEWSLVCMALNLRRLQGPIASAAATG